MPAIVGMIGRPQEQTIWGKPQACWNRTVPDHEGGTAEERGRHGFLDPRLVPLMFMRIESLTDSCPALPNGAGPLCPVVGSWPDKDFTTKAAAILETELTAAGIPQHLKVYPGLRHAFFIDTWRNYHADAGADSWRRVLAFFAERVKGSVAAHER